MKFKYMIRGLGIGIIITAAVMGACNRHAVADARAAVLKEYGLGEDGLLAEGTEAASETLSEDASAEETTEQVILRDEEQQEVTMPESEAGGQPSATDTTQADLDATPSEPESSEQDVSSSEAATSEPSTVMVVVPTDEEVPSGETIDIVIESGDDSGTVARKLQNAGLIENAAEYDAFLMQHGYDKKLSTGTKTISVTDDWQAIADKLSRK